MVSVDTEGFLKFIEVDKDHFGSEKHKYCDYTYSDVHTLHIIICIILGVLLVKDITSVE